MVMKLILRKQTFTECMIKQRYYRGKHDNPSKHLLPINISIQGGYLPSLRVHGYPMYKT